ncbi:2-dehydropantoate 2-reductase [Sphingomonas sp. BT-65]|uniref:2-dehydropantoate 2-reductase n=1 Tax=Sphingomonas sp. BT-65 TaxID=2989821 RepID=UPI00223573B7|nr:2-dehydropantoate 2-reductase [Sphingomonas sp. BT-65]MCW4460300.1 2-dehydropantoate 2-reductase [Sphingomonas sp. BT-65]
MTKIAVVGTGAIGATIAAWLIADPALDVTLCARTPFERLRVQTPDGDLESQPLLLTDPDTADPVDWVIVATKTYDAAGASRWLDRLVHDGTRVAILQNGVEHLSRFPQIDPSRIVPVVVDIPAERRAPGDVVQRRTGSLTIPAGPASDAFAVLFATTPIELRLTDDWLTAAWQKLAINCAGVVSALTLKPAGIAHDPDIAELMRGLVRECIAVGRAEGAVLDDEVADKVVEGYRTGPADSINSIHADRLAGRETEIDARNEVIVRLGVRHGIDAPLNRMAATIIRAS